MTKIKTVYFCTECGNESPKWVGKCPACNQYNTMVEEIKETKKTSSHTSIATNNNSPQKISELKIDENIRIKTTYSEFNRVLGGGIVSGSLVLIGGDPGIGKSTLLLQMCGQIALNHKVLYVSGEESVQQIKSRAERLNIISDKLYIYSENNLLTVINQVDHLNPGLIVIDSIQTIYLDYIESAPGSVSQVREATATLMKLAKSKNIPTFIVGHVTKDGAIAGPKMLEHMVDTVLYFEGENYNTYRILRAVKNRFGSTNEIGIFDMKEDGLIEVLNPSGIFLEDRSLGYAGTSVVASLEGTRPILVEIQALLAPTNYNNPKRTASGIDNNKLSLLLAVLEKRSGYQLQNQDAYIKVTGGVKIVEPATDLAIIMSIVSSYKNKALNPYDVFIGEVGLTGEVRRVSRIEERCKEAYKMGFKRAFIPNKDIEKYLLPTDFIVVGVRNIDEVIEYAIGDNLSL
ncbi:MAG: radA [Haloplasmataceae bacterium]|jgi:DNA repair protein RadA/Sms|nr:radA [Haloplasmataceae bacterium]